ncbi:flagellar hook-length control protein FliK [Sphingomonas sp. Leaf231]|uniref:flagellar hook-length control protein FliK n=1 Tax=Sphingomonas sp. Leaf231 TaxID=1736301 RepID=UPI000B16CA1C|nr:flagellar hook-length control protein FliK [Sphingomonas sp. Leaf231]
MTADTITPFATATTAISGGTGGAQGVPAGFALLIDVAGGATLSAPGAATPSSGPATIPLALTTWQAPPSFVATADATMPDEAAIVLAGNGSLAEAPPSPPASDEKPAATIPQPVPAASAALSAVPLSGAFTQSVQPGVAEPASQAEYPTIPDEAVADADEGNLLSPDRDTGMLDILTATPAPLVQIPATPVIMPAQGMASREFTPRGTSGDGEASVEDASAMAGPATAHGDSIRPASSFDFPAGRTVPEAAPATSGITHRSFAIDLSAAPSSSMPAASPSPVTDATLRLAYPAEAPLATASLPQAHAFGGRLGAEVGAIVRRQIAAGREEVTVRLDPAEFGRIHIRFSFEQGGELRAVVATESPAALELLRRDVGQLDRALAQAGVRTDAGSFRFDEGQSGGSFAHPHPARSDRHFAANGEGETPSAPLDPITHRAAPSGRVDMLA